MNCPKCGKRIAGRVNFCPYCGYKDENGAMGGRSKKDKAPMTPEKKKKITLAILIPSIILVVAIGIAVAVLVLSNIFRVGKVSRVELGSDEAKVIKLLGEPDVKEEHISASHLPMGASAYVYYEKKAKKIIDKINAVGEDDEDIEDWDDLDNAIGEIDKLYEKLEKLKYKSIIIIFDSYKTVFEVIFNKNTKYDEEDYFASWEEKKAKEFSLNKNIVTVGEKLSDGNLTYEAKYEDGSYRKGIVYYLEDFSTSSEGKQKSTFDNGWTAEDVRIEVKAANVVVTTANTNGGRVSGTGYYRKGETATLRATPNTNYEFDGWYQGDTLISKDNPYEYKYTDGTQAIEGRFVHVVHEYGAWQTTPATCTTPETRRKVCECGDVVEETTSGALGHDWENEWTIDANPTCTQNGSKSHHCTRCDEKSNVTSIASLGHDYNEVVTQPTCTEKGYTTHTCARCGDIYKTNVINALGHNYVDGVCSRCGEDEPPTEGLEYELNEDGTSYTLASIGSAYDEEGRIVIPKTYNNLPVTSIGEDAFEDCSGLTSITIPDSVTSIGDDAFRYCAGLTSVTIPNSVTSIGNYAFRGCRKLTSITIPNSVTSIGDDAFYDCSGLKSVIIGNGVTSIGEYAFYDCSGLKSVIIGNGVTSIGSWAFCNCTGLTSITIPNSVTSIGNYAFKYCYKLVEVYNKSSLTITKGSEGNGYVGYYAKNVYTEEGGSKLSIDENSYIIYTDGDDRILVGYIGNKTKLTLPNDITEIYKYAFYGRTGLTTITIPNSVTSIGGSAFRGCRKLTSITIPDSVTSIGDDAFRYCTGLTSVTIPNSVTSIGSGAFSGCTGLTSVTIPNSVTSIGNEAFRGCTGLTSITIPNSVTSIGNYAFEDCIGLTSITIPNSVTSIGNEAFRGCTGLTSITIPNSVTSIGNEAFRGCTGLTFITVDSSNTVYDSRNNCNAIIKTATNTLVVGCQNTVIPDSVTSIGDFAFEDCTGLTSITIPDSVTSIGSYAFQGCPIETATIPAIACSYIKSSSLKTVVITSGESIGSGAFSWCSGLTSVTIPSSVTSIGSSAFAGCSGLTSVTIPNSVTTISSSAFYGCTGLTSVTIPNSVTTISSSAFYGCTGLTSVTIPNSVTSIDYDAFYNCTGLTSVTIPNSVTSIGNEAFRGCTGLTFITVDSSNTVYDSRNNCNAIIKTATNTLVVGCQNTVIPDSVTSIGSGAFSGCTGLTSITIPDSVTSIGSYAFYSCRGLKSITIPDSVTSIGYSVFYNCSGLTSITFGGTIEQWNAISKGSSWDSSTGNYTIHCTDGDIAK